MDEEPILRRGLFKTRCKVVGKCCKVIINSGSLENLASEELVIVIYFNPLFIPLSPSLKSNHTNLFMVSRLHIVPGIWLKP